MRKPYEIDSLTHLTTVIKWNERKKKKKKIFENIFKTVNVMLVKKLLIIGNWKKKNIQTNKL